MVMNMTQRMAECTKLVVDGLHEDLTSDATLYSAKKKIRTSNSICDTNGLRVVDKNDEGEEIVLVLYNPLTSVFSH